jgi:hypothetical protein
MLNNKNNLINSTSKEKLTYELWLKEYRKKHCETCLIGVPNPHSCYVCYQERKAGFHCSHCSRFIYYSEGQVCEGLYNTGTCFCNKCQGLIKKWLGNKNCACEYSLAGYSAGHSIHNYRLTINGLVKPFFKGSKLWIKLVCRSCSKVIKSFGLNCSCYLKKKEHQHLYSKERCLNCAIGDYVRPLSKGDLRSKYKEYCQEWQEREEIWAQISIKRQYQYGGESYWAECSFCGGDIRGKVKDKGGLARNKVSFWTGEEVDGRVICGGCLRDKKVVKELGIKRVKRQMLYNYRGRRMV